jgi:hypothetical protein
MIVNENILQIQRGIAECQHTFEILVDAFLHAQDGVIQPLLITIAKIKDMMGRESLLDGLDFPSFPSQTYYCCYFLSKFISSVCSSNSFGTIYPISIV